MLGRVTVVAALAAATFVPAGAAASAPRVRLALLPLPKSALGRVGRPLRMAHDSGVVSNAEAASQATGTVTAKQLQHLGRVTGYLLDYGTPFGSGSRVHQIQTEVDRYRSVAAAERGLAFWRRDEQKATLLKNAGLDVALRQVRLSRVGGDHWAYAGTVRLNGLKPIRGVDAEVRAGTYLLDVSVSAGSPATATRLASKLARALERRVQLALAGRLHARPVALPHPLQAGPPAHGPNPDGMVLTAADLGGTATVQHAGYSKPKNSLDGNALSAYDLTFTPAGSFPYLAQEILVGRSKLEVEYYAAIAAAAVVAGLGNKVQATSVDVAGVGDNARGQLLTVALGSGRTAYEAVVVLYTGRYLDFVIAASTSQLTTADVQSLAQAAATRLNSGLAG